MHIGDGILPASMCGAGYAATAPIMWYSLHKMKKDGDPRENVPKASLLTAAFFVASWIHIPVPPTSVHLVLGGLMGVVLGYFAFPAVVIGLFFQAVMFQHGGLSTLGVNAIIMGAPALVAYHLFRIRRIFGRENRVAVGIFGFLSGAIAIGLGTGLFLIILLNTMNIPAGFDEETERTAIWTLAAAHVPLMFIEGAFTAFVAVFLQKVNPRLLSA